MKARFQEGATIGQNTLSQYSCITQEALGQQKTFAKYNNVLDSDSSCFEEKILKVKKIKKPINKAKVVAIECIQAQNFKNSQLKGY